MAMTDIRLHPLLQIEQELWEQGYTCLAGVDEAGRGPLAGPVVVAGVIFRPGTFIKGVTDSKMLTEKERENFFEQIQEQAQAFHVEIIPHDVIDKINILQASLKGMRACAEKMSVKPDFVLADGNKAPFPSGHHYYSRQRAVVKGDARSFTIAAASILAKVTRDRLMTEYDRIFPQYQFAKNKGYPTPEHIQLVRQYGLSAIHRKTFCTHILQEQLGFQFE